MHFGMFVVEFGRQSISRGKTSCSSGQDLSHERSAPPEKRVEKDTIMGRAVISVDKNLAVEEFSAGPIDFPASRSSR